MKSANTLRAAASGGLAVILTVNCACTALGPAGRGGWNADERKKELEKASARFVTPAPPPPPSIEAEVAPPFVSAAPDAPLTLDLESALDLAHRRNRLIAAADESVNAAAGSVAVARAALLPTAGVRGAYSWYSDEQSNSFVPPCAAPPCSPEISITIREKDFATVGLAARLAIDLSGELRHGLYSAQASYRAERARAWATRLQEESAVAAAYYGLLEAERLREVGLQTVELYSRQFSDASSRFDLGRLTRNGVLVVEVALIEARQGVVRLDNSVAAARRSLNDVTGLAIDAPTSAVDVTSSPDLPSLEQAISAVTTHNPLVTAMLEEVAAAEERLTAARRARFPRFHASGAYDATTQDTITPNNYGSVGVGVDVDLYSFAREGEIARLEAAAARNRLLLDRTRRDVEVLVRGAHDGVRERVLGVQAATAAVRQAEENLRIRQVQFDEGRATSEDLLDAGQLLTRSRALLASAIYQSHVRRAELQQLMGEPLAGLAETSGVAGPPAARRSDTHETKGESR